MSRLPMDPVDGTDRHRAPPHREATLPGHDNRTTSVPDLLRKLSGEGSELVRQEIALAKAEMQEKIETAKRSAGAMAAGAGLMLAGLLFALWALNTGVTAALVQVVDAEIAVWLAPLLLAVILLASGWGLISTGRSTMADEGLAPEETQESLRNDGRWAKSKVDQVKEEITR